MKVLHCIPNMAGGGAERQLTYLVKAQLELGLDVSVVLCAGGPNMERLRKTNVPIYLLKGSGNHDPLLLLRLYLLVRRLRPDMVHTWLLQMDVLGGLAAYFTGTPFVLSERSSAAMYSGSVKWKLRELVARKSSAVIANSAGGVEYWQTVLPVQHAFIQVPNAVPIDEIEATPGTDPDLVMLPADIPRILFVGRLSEEKRVALLLEAFTFIAGRSDAVLLLCGTGKQEAELRALVEQNSALSGRVYFLSYQKNIWGLFKKCQMFVSLSRFEGCPNAVMEAMSCGLPLFLSDIPQHREIAGDNAWYVSSDPGEIADRLVQALQSCEKNRILKKAARDALQVYTPHHIALQVKSCYESVLKPKRTC